MGEPFIQQKSTFLAIDCWQKENSSLVAGFTTREGGVSQPPFDSLNVGFHVNDLDEDVQKNRELIAEALSFPLNQWVGSEQVHKATIKKVTKEHQGLGSRSLQDAISATDGLYTKESGILLTSLYADCVPLIFYAKNQGIIGVAHAGWKGTVQLIGPKMISLWQDREGVPLEDIQVAIAPCISGNAYEVDDLPIESVLKVFPEAVEKKIYTENERGRYQLDLRLLNAELLISAGLKREQLLISSICTANDPRMYSYRADGGKTGRMMSFIGLM
ncbi:peptidoglycan editing factor PgeF [Alkalihalophilus lindianensis]|uniref:Purine nucleoside phosphorylase n=1 Tax=Alkalihalophilus lindianensis TaxID=1630542 RepID=A0ABU3XBY0_9BACI|nr:peptidoglycan editing factor PgeF [Alkalihalophilus lindianensis]MDV2685348.1 peptidoglycan editing factor PgeF [Alkalihalophilus lindianensis]